MIHRFVLMIAALFLGLLADFSEVLAQSCVIHAPRYGLNADTVDWSMKIASGRSCVGGVRFGNVEIEGVKLVSPPQFGQVALEGPGFRYTSKPNYTGQDSFSLAVLGRINKIRGSATIRIIVSVGETAPINPSSRTASADVTPPSVAFITPSNGSTASGSSVTLMATASDNVAVANVQFLVDGAAIGSPVIASPYTTTWDSTKVTDGSHLLYAVAQDTSGNYATSSITIMVDNIGP